MAWAHAPSMRLTAYSTATRPHAIPTLSGTGGLEAAPDSGHEEARGRGFRGPRRGAPEVPALSIRASSARSQLPSSCGLPTLEFTTWSVPGKAREDRLSARAKRTPGGAGSCWFSPPCSGSSSALRRCMSLRLRSGASPFPVGTGEGEALVVERPGHRFADDVPLGAVLLPRERVCPWVRPVRPLDRGALERDRHTPDDARFGARR